MATTEQVTVKEFLEITAQVYDENTKVYLSASKNPQNVNYLVGKMMVKSKGMINPELAMKVVKAIVESEIQNIFKTTI